MSFLDTNSPLNKKVVFFTNSVNAVEMAEIIIVISVFKVSAMCMVILKQSIVYFKLIKCSKQLQQCLKYLKCLKFLELSV